MDKNLDMGEVLMKHLSHPGIDKDALKNYSAQLATISKSNFKFERIWWRGIPYPDHLHLQTRIPLKNIAEIQKLISPEIGSIEIFPLGIPFPEELQTILKIPLKNPRFNEKVIGK
ncbi:MAG: hypothetical protein ABIN48_07405 [Ginsengibacter sp.]